MSCKQITYTLSDMHENIKTLYTGRIEDVHEVTLMATILHHNANRHRFDGTTTETNHTIAIQRYANSLMNQTSSELTVVAQ